MRTCSPEDTVTSLVDSGSSLAIACLRCHHRALFGTRQIGVYEAAAGLPLRQQQSRLVRARRRGRGADVPVVTHLSRHSR
jgi:hypothetical protein